MLVTRLNIHTNITKYIWVLFEGLKDFFYNICLKNCGWIYVGYNTNLYNKFIIKRQKPCGLIG